MNKREAKDLVLKTFENEFNEAQFTYFIKNLLNDLDESKKQTWAGSYIKESFRDAIQSYKRLGQYTDTANNVIDVLVVKVKKDITLERARTLQRNFVANHLKTRNHEAALVAFHTEGSSDWRFSLVKMEFNLTKTKVEIELSPARRYSFLVGGSERSHTAQSQFQKILLESENPTLDDIEHAFNIEVVTKEFFLEYRNLFIQTKLALDNIIKKDEKLKKDFKEKNINSVDFSKKLLGQIIFLYFLQKKGWFGVERDADWGEGSKHFLRELFEKKHAEYNNFYNDILEPLFYEALRIDRGHDDHYYSRFDCKIPFLNGGLFDPIGNYDWVHTDIILPNELFSNSNVTKEGDIGDGILDIFDRYNFTVIEDEPLEKEVAIDPELLGKTYEKFNAIRADNFDEYLKALQSGKKGEENKFNKQYGVYYTPREIVHYMCREALINYLASEFDTKIDSYEQIGNDQLDALGNQTKEGQLDLESENRSLPYIPKEDIETFINYGELLGENEAVVVSKGKETETYSFKLPESIRKNAELIDEKLANVYICDPAVGSGAFPVGMMHEIVGARNLLSLFIKKGDRLIYKFKRECIERSLYGVDIDSGAVEIAKLRLWLSLVVDEDSIENIKPLPNLDYKIICGDSLVGFPEGIVKNQKIEKEIETLKKRYFNSKEVNEKRDLAKRISLSFAELLQEAKQFSDQVSDISFDYEVFFSEIFHRCEKKGFDIVIGNPPYGHTINNNKKYFKENYISCEGKHEIYKYFIEKGLKLLTRGGVLSYITSDTWTSLGYFKKLRQYIFENYRITAISQSLYDVFESATVDTNIYFIQNLPPQNDFILISNELEPLENRSLNINSEFSINLKKSNSVVDKINKTEKCLSDFCEVWQGLIAYSSKNQPRTFTSSTRETKFHRKLLYGGDISRYNITWSGEYLKYGDWLHRPRPSYIFDNPKILIQRIRNPQLKDRIVGAFDEDKYINGTGLSNILLKNNIKKPSLKYLLALLNSRLINYWFGYHFTDVNIKPDQLRKIPIRTSRYEQRIVEIVETIINAKNKGFSESWIRARENMLDLMVYATYEMQYKDIKIIDPDIENIISKEEYEKFKIE